MKKSLRKDSRGIAHLALILGVVVIVVIAGVGYYVFNKQKKSDSTSSNSSKSAVVDSAAVDECNKLYNDKDLCKFSVSYNDKASYKATYATTDATGKTSTMIFESDGKDNFSTISKDGSTEVAAYISLNGDTYMKDETDGSWTKYPKSTSNPVPASDNPTSDLKIDTKEESKPADQRIVYKKLGKERCGNANCFKYQIIDPSQPGTESIVWFGDKDYQLHKWSFKDKDGSSNVGEFTYTTVTISAPSPVKEASATPSQADIQKALQDAQAGQ